MSRPISKQELTQAINRVAASIFDSHFVSAKQQAYQPRKGTVMFRLWQGKRLSLRHQQAWYLFTRDLYAAAGKSGPVVGGYSEGGSGRNPSEHKIPTAYANAELKRLDAIWDKLMDDDKSLLRDLVANELRNDNKLDVELIGWIKSGYKDEGQAYAAGAAHVTSLLERLAGMYGF